MPWTGCAGRRIMHHQAFSEGQAGRQWSCGSGGGGLQDWLGHTVPTMQLLPGDMETADAQLTTPGRAVLQCNVDDHITAGDCLPPGGHSDYVLHAHAGPSRLT